jgi:hypothetical protein
MGSRLKPAKNNVCLIAYTRLKPGAKSKSRLKPAAAESAPRCRPSFGLPLIFPKHVGTIDCGAISLGAIDTGDTPVPPDACGRSVRWNLMLFSAWVIGYVCLLNW